MGGKKWGGPFAASVKPLVQVLWRASIMAVTFTSRSGGRLITKNWDKGYDEHLHMTNLPSLADIRLYLKLCSLYKIVHNMTCFPPDIVVPKVTRSYTSTPFTLYQPFAHTNCFFSSFVPHTVSHWNSLPESVVSCPSLATFKHSLTMFLCTK